MRITNPTVLTAITFLMVCILQILLLVLKLVFIVVTLGNTDFPVIIEIKE